MIHLALLFALIVPAHAARGVRADLSIESAAFAELRAKFEQFRESLDETDTKLEKLRLAVNRHQYKDASNMVDEISSLAHLSARRFQGVENFYTQATKKRFDFHRLSYLDFDAEPDFVNYLAFRRNNRFGTGILMDLQLAAWRGLEFGKKQEEPPSDLRSRIAIDKIPMRAGDLLMIMMTNGGLIRGRLEGMTGDKRLVLREILPNTMGRYQKTLGYYRILGLNEAARIEIVRLPNSITSQESPYSTVTAEGKYSYYAQQALITRIYLRPDDVELLTLVKRKRFAEVESPQTVTTVNSELEERPAYSSLFFFNCEALLRR